MNFQKGTFNTISQGRVDIGGHFPVWSRVRELYQGGGVIDHTKYTAGMLIGAGTPVKFNGPGKMVDVIAGEAYDAKKTYAVGDMVENDGKVYKNKTAITTPEEFTTAKWEDVTGTANGLVFDDVCIPDDCTLATCAVVRAGRIYADRVLGASIPKEMEALMPMIEFVRES